jgi:hypothetical protein
MVAADVVAGIYIMALAIVAAGASAGGAGV